MDCSSRSNSMDKDLSEEGNVPGSGPERTEWLKKSKCGECAGR